MRLDDQDRAALLKLDDDFTISTDGERAVISGEMELKIIRPDHDGGAQFWLTLQLPKWRRTRRSDSACPAAGTARHRTDDG
jgi:hypothetical protein